MFTTAGTLTSTFMGASPFVTTHVVRLKLFRLKGSEKYDCRTLAEISDSFIKHGLKMRFFLTVFSLQPIHLSSYEDGLENPDQNSHHFLAILVYTSTASSIFEM